MSANEHLTVHHGGVCEWRGRWIRSSLVFLMVSTHENHGRCQPGFRWTLLPTVSSFHHFQCLRRRRHKPCELLLQKQSVSKRTFDCSSWKRVKAVDQKLSCFSHGPDPREPQPLPARFSVDVTANCVVWSVHHFQSLMGRRY